MHIETISQSSSLLESHPEVQLIPLVDIDEPEKDPVESSPRLSVLFMFFLLGTISLLTFNLGISSVSLLTDLNHGKDLGTNISRAFSIFCASTTLIICFLKIKKQNIVLAISIFILFVVLILIPLFSSAIFFLVLIGVSGIVSAIILSLSYSFASQFGSKAAAAVSTGNGFCGVFATVLIWLLFFLGDQYKLKCYFLISAFSVGVFLVYYLFKMNDPLISEFLVPKAEKQNHDSSILKHIWIYCVAELMVFVVTLILFPGYIYKTHSTFSPEKTQLIISSIFMVFDFIGRWLPSVFVWPGESCGWVPSFVRLLFFPIFMLSTQRIINVGDPYWTFGWIFLFSLTNGYFGTVAMIHGTNHSKLQKSQRRIAGFYMTCSLELGVLAAMGFTFALPKVPQT